MGSAAERFQLLTISMQISKAHTAEYWWRGRSNIMGERSSNDRASAELDNRLNDARLDLVITEPVLFGPPGVHPGSPRAGESPTATTPTHKTTLSVYE